MNTLRNTASAEKETGKYSCIAIDLKSFYASVECVERGLDPLRTHLVVADRSRTQKTICLAVTPSLKQLGIPGRPRLFEVEEAIRELNAARRTELRYGAPSGSGAIPGTIPGRLPQRLPQRLPGDADFTAGSWDAELLRENPFLEIGFLTAVPRMQLYMDYSTRIYQIYLRYIAPEDIHVYSIDEVFIDASSYGKLYGCTPRELAEQMIREVLQETGITATAGIGTNLYLAKAAMDILAKHVPADRHGVRIAELDEQSYRRLLWDHRPLTDFWRVGAGYARRLENCGLRTMGDIARCSLEDPELLYRQFGINAEYLIDHAWGREEATIAAIHSYRPKETSLCSGQVLQRAYSAEEGRLIVREMAEQLSLSLVEKGLTTELITLYIGYEAVPQAEESGGLLLRDGRAGSGYVRDRYGRILPKPSHGSRRLSRTTASTRLLTEAAAALYDQLVIPGGWVRRFNISAEHLHSSVSPGAAVSPACIPGEEGRSGRWEQMDLFTDYAAEDKRRRQEAEALRRENQLQRAVVQLRQRYGRNAMLKGMNLEEGAQTVSRNLQIGGHRA